MTKHKSPKPDDYQVGYGRPPKATQFAPGKSGNPKGRPKGTRPVGAILQEVLGQKIVVTENGKSRRLPFLEVLFRRLANDAVRSDKAAMKLLLALVDRYNESPEAKTQLNELLAEDQAILERYLRSPDNSNAAFLADEKEANSDNQEDA
jgi:hypothetical protein